MVDYTIDSLPVKNYFVLDAEEIPYNFFGLGYTNINGNWAYACDLYGTEIHATFLQHINVCENNVAGITQLIPGNISCFPNPANNRITITSKGEISSIEIINFTGQTTIRLNGDNLKAKNLDVSTLAAGQYLVRITSECGVVTTRLTIAH
jgi:hypothetical protein